MLVHGRKTFAEAHHFCDGVIVELVVVARVQVFSRIPQGYGHGFLAVFIGAAQDNQEAGKRGDSTASWTEGKQERSGRAEAPPYFPQ